MKKEGDDLVKPDLPLLSVNQNASLLQGHVSLTVIPL